MKNGVESNDCKQNKGICKNVSANSGTLKARNFYRI